MSDELLLTLGSVLSLGSVMSRYLEELLRGVLLLLRRYENEI